MRRRKDERRRKREGEGEDGGLPVSTERVGCLISPLRGVRHFLEWSCSPTFSLVHGLSLISEIRAQQTLGNTTIPKTPKFWVEGCNVYYAAPLFAQYDPPRSTSKTIIKHPLPPLPLIPSPTSTSNPFDGMEVEEVEFVPYSIAPTKFKPKRSKVDLLKQYIFSKKIFSISIYHYIYLNTSRNISWLRCPFYFRFASLLVIAPPSLPLASMLCKLSLFSKIALVCFINGVFLCILFVLFILFFLFLYSTLF